MGKQSVIQSSCRTLDTGVAGSTSLNNAPDPCREAPRRQRSQLPDIVRDEGDWERWVAFFLRGVADTADAAVETAKRLMALFDEDRLRIQGAGRRANSALRVHDALKARPVNRLQDIAATTGLSFPAATAGMKLLAELDVAREVTGKQRNRVYVYTNYLAVLSEGTENI